MKKGVKSMKKYEKVKKCENCWKKCEEVGREKGEKKGGNKMENCEKEEKGKQ